MTLIMTLLVGAVTLAIALGMLALGANSQLNTSSLQTSVQARNLADACTEEALQVIHDSTSYTGSNTFTLDANPCTYTVANTGTSTRTINTIATISNVTRKTLVYVTINASNIIVTSWQEVP